ncbi:PTS sugar transporter subunit IIC [Halanaerobaculum tunisiense]
MQKLIRFLEEKILPVAGKLGEQRHLQAVRDGLVAILPLLIVGSFALIVAFPPISFLAELVEPYIGKILEMQAATFGIMALAASFTIAYSLADDYDLDQLSAGILSMVAFLVVTPFTDGNITGQWIGSNGLFVAIILSLLSVEIQRMIVKRDLVIKMPAGVPPAVTKSFIALIPTFAIVVLSWGVNQLAITFTSYSIPKLINQIVATPLMYIGGTLPGALAAILAISIFWIVGVHGAALVMGTLGSVMIPLAEQNAEALSQGAEVLPNIVSQPFIDFFVNMGGSGSTFTLALLMIFATKSKQLKTLGKTAIGPGLFNINEPIIFGMPIVMNPIMMVPFILAPLSAGTITYIAMQLELVARPYAIIPWTTPVFLSGFLTTGDWRAIILQLITMSVAGMIYYPFLKYWDKQKLKEEEKESKVQESEETAAAV